MAGSLIGAAIGAGASIYGASKQASAAKKAARQQQAGIERGINDSGQYYEEGQNYLAPYISAGAESADLLRDIRGDNGVERQNAALAMYQSNPSAQLLNDVNNEAVRRTIGTFAAGGNANSGAATEELGRRLSDIRLADYGNWQNLSKDLYGVGASAASNSASLAQNRGDSILNARTGQGTARASGTVGAANAQAAGLSGATNWLSYATGRNTNNFSDLFKTAGNVAPQGSLPWQSNYSPAMGWLSGN